MEFLIDECHKRNMEFHAWLNPYRASTAGNTRFADSHIYNKHPEWFVTYNKQILFDPGLPESRQFINKGSTRHCQPLRCGRHPYGRLFLPLSGSRHAFPRR